MDLDWLLTIVAGGQSFRFSSKPREVDGHVYLPGIDADALLVSEGAAEDVSIVVTSATLAPAVENLDSGTATLEFYADGERRLVASGAIVSPAWGAADESITFGITRTIAGETRGSQIPDPLSRVDTQTWPDGTASAKIGTAGTVYPVIFGYPGDDGSGTAIPCVPIPLAQAVSGDSAHTYFVVSEDGDADISSVEIRRQTAATTNTQTCVEKSDLLGKRLICADCTSGGTGTIPSDTNTGITVGFLASTGGGVERSLYDCIRYVLRRWGSDSVDWAKLGDVSALLEPFNVDSFVNTTIADPWVLIEHWLQELPAEIRIGREGYYIVEHRMEHDLRFVIDELRSGEGVRLGNVTVDGAPGNEVSVLYRQDPETGWRGQVIVCGSTPEVIPADVEVSDTALVLSQPAIASFAKYKRRQVYPAAIDWTWDQATARLVGEHILRRTALPGLLVQYTLPFARIKGWREGREILINDADLGWVSRPAIIDAPIALGVSGAVVSFRVPQ